MTLCFLPSILGCWFYGFACLYIALFNPSRKPIGKLPTCHPILMNTICFGFPIVISIGFFCLGIFVAYKHNVELKLFTNLEQQLTALSLQWQPNDITNIQKIDDFAPLFLKLFYKVGLFLTLCRVICLCWAIVSAFVILFFIITVSIICKILNDMSKAEIQKSQAVEEGVFRQSDPINTEPGSLESKHDTSFTSRVPFFKSAKTHKLADKLSFSYHVMVASCGLITVALFWYFCSGLILVLKMNDIVYQLHWRYVVFTLSLSSGLLFSVALFLQSLRSVVSYRWDRAISQSQSEIIKSKETMLKRQSGLSILPTTNKECITAKIEGTTFTPSTIEGGPSMPQTNGAIIIPEIIEDERIEV
ncbi:hypothetical protein O181_033412 [Austropuccinia psidii MF-1]|uniref:Uncharacterized protein n=1 Tax=Austropuccinia psidii MF-1 TaxID=1389203 RepID=A0A9Q3D4K4_9BASI|nr:hypothetical protein [Austropuccinia psidii MF-1]